ncbi:cobaltochelatase, CobN subunit [Coleofasciculus chthonoplastes PCC 7420]|uniref:Cobaltochelatase, CobN subunit n=1 Tax=Coleofasciculus chthonoplastes PCC 7420 TaxID=118168 RepID=B4VN29_9CYAN|nr:cobaltochelatase subunit CobN [Coleofasciculus chthonoplastes]EDX76886.1 cobaltochelatase, CobN subunit [Coleofasciculus chthonoplastes PCC 7420]
MHRIAATPGGWNPQAEGVIFIEQTPAPIIVITAADTDIQTLAASMAHLPPDFPAIRAVNLLQLQQELTIDTYTEQVLNQADVIIIRLLGGSAYWSYGLEVVQTTVEQTGANLILLPGDDRPDPNLVSHSTISLTAVHQLWRYFIEGGVENCTNALKFVADLCLGGSYEPLPPKPVPRVGIYGWGDGTNEALTTNSNVGILFYRAHYLAGNTSPIDALCQALVEQQLHPVPVFVSSLRDPEVQAEVLSYFQPKDDAEIEVLLNTTSFSVAKLTDHEKPGLELWKRLDVPVLQVIFSGGTKEQWQEQFQGLTPRDTAMNVSLPEVDGRIITRAVSFKAVQTWNPLLETDVVVYESVRDRINFVTQLAANWVKLRQTPPAERRIALILANYPNRDGRLANGVGLDTPASCVELLKALQGAGYQVEDSPETGDELIQRLTTGVTNDPEGWELRPVQQGLSRQDYQDYFDTLPLAVQQGICNRWHKESEGSIFSQGRFCTNVTINSDKEVPKPAHTHSTFNIQHSTIPIPGIQLGNIFVGIQPSRGYDSDPALNYHAPDLEPTPAYLAFYYWLRQKFGAQAMVHVGKHGNLEWLPGKSLALSETCYPEVALGTMPHLYPFIVNDPGEGSQAKRRSQAVIIDHLTPPMTRAELYGSLQQLEGLVDEYYEAQSLDPSRLPTIRDRITQLVIQENLHHDLGFEDGETCRDLPWRVLNTETVGAGFTDNIMSMSDSLTKPALLGEAGKANLLTQIDSYLCELKEAQIRDGLHILGQCPQGRLLRDLTVAIARHPGRGRLGLTRAIAQDWGWDFDPLTPEGDSKRQAIAQLEAQASQWVESLISKAEGKSTLSQGGFCTKVTLNSDKTVPKPAPTDAPWHVSTFNSRIGQRTQQELDWIRDRLLPALTQTCQEITHLLQGLDGRYVESGAAGAPTRGRPEVLPTGRNFYSVDIRAIPTETAWDVGRKAAEAVIERYTQDNGEYPQTLALSVWGTSAMRTGGDDLAQALALLGVQPIWDRPSRRVVDFEILPLSVLGRPRVDVTLRISGFFRDAFPNLIDLFYNAVVAVAALNEAPEDNPLAAQVKQETAFWCQEGLSEEEAEARSHYRVFGSKPGAYGAGLQGLIEAQNWRDEQDLARAYMNWSSYAYCGTSSPNQEGIAAPEAFEQRLKQLQVVLHNQDNREHDLLDSDDYYQFQGGLTASVRALTGKNPQTYFGDNSIPENPRVRRLQEEIARVYRSRVVNPKWIAGVMRHGYKGAFEMAATVDYLFAYDATANCVADYMYQGVTEAYLLDEKVQEFIQQKNPWVMRDMAERLLEAHQRSLWQSAQPEILEKLRAIALQAEGVIEAVSDPNLSD